MDYGRALSWSRAVAGLFLAKPEDFTQCWEDQQMSTALSVFLLLRRYARTDLPQDAVSAFDLALQLPVGPKALSLQHQHHFMSLLICLLHRAFLGLYGAGGNTDLKFLRQTAQVVRRTVEHSSLDYDHRILFLMARSRARQLWFVRAMNVDYTLLSVALSRRDLLVAPTNGADCPICHGRRIALEFWNMSVSVTTPQASVMDAVIALMRDIRRGCPPGHHSAQGLDDALAHMLRSRCQLQYDASLHDEFLTVSMHSLLNNSSTKYSEVGTVMDLSTALLQRFQVSRNLDQLATAAQLCENALERLPPDYPKRAAVYHSGGAVYSVRYVHEGDVWLLKQAIHLQLQCIACTVADDAFRAERCRFLGVLLHMLYLKEGDSADLHGILTIIREVLVLRPDGHPDQAEACTELAAALLGFFEPSGCVPVLEEAIQLYEKALSLKPIGDRARARSCERLAEALCARHRAKGDVAALQRAVILRQEYLHLNSMPEADPLSRARAQCGLASTKTILDDASGSHVSEQECVALFLEALDVLPKEDSSHIFAVEELLSRAQSCFFRTGNLSLLDTAIRHGRQATLASPYQRHQNLSIRLAQTLQTRYGFLGQTADLDEAISLLRMFFAANPPTYSDRIGASCILAKSLRLEFERTGDVIRLDEAGSLLQKAYAICPEGHSQRRSICAHYAGLLRQQFHTHDTHDIVLIDRAIELCRESLRLIVAGDAGLSQSLNSLGTCFAMRFEVVKEMSSLDEAIQLFRKALELLPPSHTLRKDLCCNLGGNLLVYVEQTKDLSYMEEIISLLKEACSGGDPRQAALSYACLARAYLIPSTPFFDSHAAVMVLREATENISEPVDLINVILQLRLLGLPQLHARDMLGIYSTIVSNLPRLSNATMSPKIRLKTLSASTAIGGASLLCAVLVGELQTGVELLENSRALFWSQALNMRDPQLEDLPSDLRVEIEYLFGALSSTPALVHENHLTPRDVLHRQNERLQSLIAEVRALPGHAHFMLGTSYEQLASAFSTTAIVIFSADMGGCRAIITTGTHSQPAHLQLHELAAEELEDLNNHLTNLGMRVGRTETSREDDGRTLGISKRRDGDSRVERLLSKLWVKVMQPVLSALNYRTKAKGRDRPRVIFCSTGLFTFLPLHAAGIYGGDIASQECVSDYAVCSYVSSLSALQRARKNLVSRAPASMSILAIAEGSAPGMPRLDTVDMEVKSVCEFAEKGLLRILSARTTGTTTIQHAVSHFVDADIVHLACHGVQDSQDALQSGFCLGDGRLTIEKLMKLKLPSPFLAFLSACETAKGDIKSIDQTVHLAAAMLFCGFQNVIGTMWSMRDEDGPTVARKVYSTLFAQDSISAEDVPYALDAAVQDLRSAGLPPSRWATFIHLGA